MCGVLALLTENQHRDEARQFLPEMLEPLRQSRGPDAWGLQEIEVRNQTQTLFLAHARLSIIDLSTQANQPMRDPATGYWLCFNGEIYNYKDLKSELRSSYEFRTQSDTEVLLAALQIWGVERTLNQLKGMFAFVAFDPRTQILVAARDRAGEKPLSYGQIDGDWVFSSDLRVLNHHPRWQREISLSDLKRYFTYRYVPHPHSIFKNFNKLSPGHYLELNLSESITQVPKVKTYWSIIDEWVKQKQNKPTSQAELNQLLEDVVKRTVQASDVPIGCFLSGGVDSSLVAALAAKSSGADLKAYTIQFLDKGYDESGSAGQVARAIGCEHVIVPFGATEFRESFDEMIGLLDEPIAVQSFFALGYLSKRAKQDVKVCLSGDGGDEIFGGYNRYLFWAKYQQLIKGSPFCLRKNLALLLEQTRLLPLILSGVGLRQAKLKAEKICRALKSKNVLEYYLDLLTEQSSLTHAQKTEQVDFVSGQLNGNGFTGVEMMMALDFLIYLPGDVLNKVDRATMAYGLEARAPLLDIDLIRASQTLPIISKINRGVGKIPLREALASLMKNKIVPVQKLGFSSPTALLGSETLSPVEIEELSNSDLVHVLGADLRKRLSSGLPTEPNELFIIRSVSKWLFQSNYILA